MELPKRKTNRLPDYDYSTPGAYFITICTQDKRHILGYIATAASVGDGFPVPPVENHLSSTGKTAERFIQQIPYKYPNVSVDKYVIMSNHIHLMLRISGVDGTGDPSPTHRGAMPTVGDIIGWYKFQVTKQVNLRKGTAGTRIFQRSYHDHVIRNERDYLRIWEYIDTNPNKWEDDCYYEKDEN